MAKAKKSKGFLSRAASLLGSIPAVGNVRNAAKKVGKAKKTLKKTVKKATKTAKRVVKSTKKNVKKSVKKKKKTAAKLKKGLKKAKKKAKRKVKKKLRKKVGKVFTKARKLKNNLSKNKRVKKLKKQMKKTVLKAKKSVKKVKSTAKKVSKSVVQNSKKLTKKVALGARAINDFAKNGFNGREVASAIVDFIPVVGNVKGAYEATFGKDPITGRKLDKAERVAAGAAVIGGPLVKGGTRGVKLVSGIVSGGKKSSGKVPVDKGTDIPRIQEVEVDFKRNDKHDSEEFARQLKDQEKGMNELTVDEYLKNRERYIVEGRAKEGNVAQKIARQEALKDKIAELRKQGLSRADATKQASKWLETKAALHNPDQIAGGRADIIGGLGDKRVNSSIGSQWKYRIDVVDEQIMENAKNMSPEQLKNTYLNVKLTQ